MPLVPNKTKSYITQLYYYYFHKSMMMMMKKKEGSLLRIIIAVTLTLIHCFLTANSEVRCIESERHALLNFKQHLTDPSNRLASWAASASDVDCCHWVGVSCHNVTGHVLQLRLRSFPPLFTTYDAQYEAQYEAYERSMFGGKINPSLLDLKNLIYLDLSYNDFGGIHIPKFLGSMGSLRYLNLSNARFGGLIPHQLGNLSNLHYLDLGSYYNSLYVMNLQWLSGLPLLQHLDLSSANLSQASDWLQEINKLPSLSELRLSFCELSVFIPPPIPSNINFSSLTTLDLSYNRFENTSILFWVFGLHYLVSLDLSYSQFQGPIPVHLQNLTSLRHLDLSDNQFQGPIPVHLQNLTSLRHLDLSVNAFNSSLPNWLYSFSHLEFLNLGSNYLQGTISSAIGNLTSAISIDLSSNELEGKVPRSLGNLCNLKEIRLSENKWSQKISEIFKSLSGCVSNRLEILEMGSAQLSGQLIDELGQFKNLVILSLGYNSISGPIPWSIGNLSSLRSLDLQSNQINGTLPENIGDMRSIESIDFSINRLSGQIPQSMSNLTFLSNLNLSNNNLIGRIPSSTQLQSLSASSFFGNKLCGPPLTEKCTINYVNPNIENKRSKGFGGHMVNWFFVSMTLGFVVGFWVVLGPLLWNKQWRILYFQFLDHLGYKLSGVVAQAWYSIVSKCCKILNI